MLRKVAVLLVACIVFSGCSKEDENAPKFRGKLPLEYEGLGGHFSFEYDFSGRILQINKISEDTLSYRFVYEQNRIIQVEVKEASSVWGSMPVNYTSGTEFSFGIEDEIYYLKTDENGNLINLSRNSDVFLTYDYAMQSNIKTVNYFNQASLQFTYTPQRGVFSYVASPTWILSFVQGYFEGQYYNAFDKVTFSSQTDYFVYTPKYKWNESGLPVQIILTPENGGTEGDIQHIYIRYNN